MKNRNRFEYIEKYRTATSSKLFCYAGINWTYCFGDTALSEGSTGRVNFAPTTDNNTRDNVISLFEPIKLVDGSKDYRLKLIFESSLLSIDNGCWTSKIPGLIDSKVITVTPSKCSFQPSSFSNYVLTNLDRYNLTSNDVKNAFADLCKTLLAGLGVFHIGNATQISIGTDQAITVLSRVVDNYYLKTRGSNSSLELIRPSSSTTFTLSDKSGVNHVFSTEYTISIKDFLEHITPFIKEYYGCKDGANALISTDSILSFINDNAAVEESDSSYGWYVQYELVDGRWLLSTSGRSGAAFAAEVNDPLTDIINYSCYATIQFNKELYPYIDSHYFDFQAGDYAGSLVRLRYTNNPQYCIKIRPGWALSDILASTADGDSWRWVTKIVYFYSKSLPFVAAKHYKSSTDILRINDGDYASNGYITTKNVTWECVLGDGDDIVSQSSSPDDTRVIPIKYNKKILPIDLISSAELSAAGSIHFYPHNDPYSPAVATYEATNAKYIIDQEDRGVNITAKVSRIPSALEIQFLDGGYKLATGDAMIQQLVNTSDYDLLPMEPSSGVEWFFSSNENAINFLTSQYVVYQKISGGVLSILPSCSDGDIASAVAPTNEVTEYTDDVRVKFGIKFSPQLKGIVGSCMTVAHVKHSDSNIICEYDSTLEESSLTIPDNKLELTSGAIGLLADNIIDVNDDSYALSSLIASYLTPDLEIISPTLTADSLSTLADELRDNTAKLLYKVEELLVSDDDEISYDDEDLALYMNTSDYYYIDVDGNICISGVSTNTRHPLSSLVRIDSFQFDNSVDAVGLPYYDTVTHTLKTAPFSKLEDMNTLITSTNNGVELLLWQLLVRIKCLTVPPRVDVEEASTFDLPNMACSYNEFLSNDLDDLSAYIDKVVEVYGIYLEESFVNTISSTIDSLADNVVIDESNKLVQESQLLTNALSSVDITADKLIASLDSDNDHNQLGRNSSVARRLSQKAKTSAKAAASKVKGTIQDTFTRLGTIKTNVSMKVQALSESIANATTNTASSLMNLLGLGAEASTSTGWADGDSITNTNALAISLDASAPLEVVGSICKCVGSILDKGVNWLYGKAKTFVDETFIDGVSFRINTSGYETLDLAQYQQRYTTESFLREYDKIGDYFYRYCEYRGLKNNVMMVYQVNSVITFIQRLDAETFMVSSNVLLDLGSNAMRDDASDIDFIDQMIYAQNRAIDDYNTFVVAWNLIAAKLNVYYPSIQVAGLSCENYKSRDEIYKRIFSGAFTVSVERTSKRVKAWGWFAVALGAVIACTGVATTAGGALMAVGASAIVGAQAAENETRNYDINSVLSKAREDSNYANKEITAAEIKGVWLDFPKGIFIIYNEMINNILFPAGYVHAGQGRTITSLDSNGISYEAYIPMAIINGAPSFKYHILTDSERKTKAWVRFAIIIAAAAAFIVGSLRATKGIRLRKKYSKLSARQWSLESELKAKWAKKGKKFDMKKPECRNAYNKAQGKLSWKLNKVSSAFGGDSAVAALGSFMSTSNNDEAINLLQDRIG